MAQNLNFKETQKNKDAKNKLENSRIRGFKDSRIQETESVVGWQVAGRGAQIGRLYNRKLSNHQIAKSSNHHRTSAFSLQPSVPRTTHHVLRTTHYLLSTFKRTGFEPAPTFIYCLLRIYRRIVMRPLLCLCAFVPLCLFFSGCGGGGGGNPLFGGNVVPTVNDVTSPTLTIQSPANNTEVAFSSVVVSGIAYDETGGSGLSVVKCNGTTASGTVNQYGTTNWSCTVTNLICGSANLITVDAYDVRGNKTTNTVNIKRAGTDCTSTDKTAPTLNITFPAETPYSTGTTPITIMGTASDEGGSGLKSVTCNTTAATGLANWSCSIALVAGANSVTVRAEDAAGNFVTSTKTINYTPACTDTATPTITITSVLPVVSGLTNPYYATQSTVTVEGIANDTTNCANQNPPASVSSIINDKGISNSGTVQNWKFVFNNLSEGENIITITAEDNSPNKNKKTIPVRIVYDNKSPALSVTSPTITTFATTSSPVKFAGAVSDTGGAGGLTVKCKNSSTNPPSEQTIGIGGSAWSCDISLIGGSNNIIIEATDSAGNKTSSNYTISYVCSVTGIFKIKNNPTDIQTLMFTITTNPTNILEPSSVSSAGLAAGLQCSVGLINKNQPTCTTNDKTKAVPANSNLGEIARISFKILGTINDKTTVTLENISMANTANTKAKPAQKPSAQVTIKGGGASCGGDFDLLLDNFTE